MQTEIAKKLLTWPHMDNTHPRLTKSTTTNLIANPKELYNADTQWVDSSWVSRRINTVNENLTNYSYEYSNKQQPGTPGQPELLAKVSIKCHTCVQNNMVPNAKQVKLGLTTLQHCLGYTVKQ